MKRYLGFLLFVILLSACSFNRVNKKRANISAAYFEKIDSIGKAASKVWDIQFNTPVLLKDESSKTIYANKPVKGFKKYENLFIGKLNDSIVFNDETVFWNGKNWLVLPFPDENNEDIDLKNSTLENIFKAEASKKGMNKVHTPDCLHLDKPSNKVWIKVESEALKRALNASTGEERHEHIRMAFAARRMRKISSGEMFRREKNMDLKIGLPVLHSLLFNTSPFSHDAAFLSEKIDSFQQNQSVMHSFATVIFSSYGLLMCNEQNAWLKTIDHSSNTTQIIDDFYQFQYQEDFVEIMKVLRSEYRGNYFEEQEEAALSLHRNLIEKYKEQFLGSSFVFIKMGKNTQYDFDAKKTFPLEDIGTVYITFEATGNWGSLKAENGVLINRDYSYIYIASPFEMKDNTATGDGWQLKLNDSYTIKPYQNSGKYFVTKK